MGAFRTTIWTLINEAAEGDLEALRAFVLRYRAPLVRYMRVKGFDTDEAEDLVQEVFLRFVERDLLAKADPERGRFRAYLLGISRNVIAKQRERESAQSRGRDWSRVPLEQALDVPAKTTDPAFDDAWFEGLIDAALAVVADENPRQHELLTLRLREELDPAQLAERVGRTAAQVRVDLHRARQRLVKALEREVTHYAANPDEQRADLQHLLRTVGAA